MSEKEYSEAFWGKNATPESIKKLSYFYIFTGISMITILIYIYMDLSISQWEYFIEESINLMLFFIGLILFFIYMGLKGFRISKELSETEFNSSGEDNLNKLDKDNKEITVQIELGRVEEFIIELELEKLEMRRVDIIMEVTPDEYIFSKSGLFSTKEIVKIQKNSVKIKNINQWDKAKKGMKIAGWSNAKIEKHNVISYPNNNYLTFFKGKDEFVEIHFTNKSSSDVDDIIVQLK